MSERVRITVNGAAIDVERGTIVAVAVLMSGEFGFRRSATGEMRGPVCGMGTCFECRVTIDGQAHARSCQMPCSDGMQVRTDG
jgi:predicted molibdopterin-dependent oxidoreductase YjgC